jgi:hypothetical protein
MCNININICYDNYGNALNIYIAFQGRMLQQIVNLYIAIYENKGHSKKAIRQNWKLVTFQNCLATPEINVREYEEKQNKTKTQHNMWWTPLINNIYI